MAIVRWILGRIILLVDFFYRPKGIKRNPQEQADLDQRMAKLSLYQYAACPFCVKVRWAMKRYSLKLNTRNIKQHPQFADQLLAEGGKLKVPCLRIDNGDGDVSWMYESSDIIQYLEQQFHLAEPAVASNSKSAHS